MLTFQLVSLDDTEDLIDKHFIYNKCSYLREEWSELEKTECFITKYVQLDHKLYCIEKKGFNKYKNDLRELFSFIEDEAINKSFKMNKNNNLGRYFSDVANQVNSIISLNINNEKSRVLKLRELENSLLEQYKTHIEKSINFKTVALHQNCNKNLRNFLDEKPLGATSDFYNITRGYYYNCLELYPTVNQKVEHNNITKKNTVLTEKNKIDSTDNSFNNKNLLEDEVYHNIILWSVKREGRSLNQIKETEGTRPDHPNCYYKKFDKRFGVACECISNNEIENVFRTIYPKLFIENNGYVNKTECLKMQ